MPFNYSADILRSAFGDFKIRIQLYITILKNRISQLIEYKRKISCKIVTIKHRFIYSF
jgi:hypothetical protein